MSDDEIASRTINVLSWDSVVPSNAIQVTVRDGLVTLAGKVNWYYQKSYAERDVRRLSGVRSVVNNIEGKVHNWDEKFAIENTAWSAPGVKNVKDRLTIGS